ncbi:hypothetical protein [Draconibacterium sediminis]
MFCRLPFVQKALCLSPKHLPTFSKFCRNWRAVSRCSRQH